MDHREFKASLGNSELVSNRNKRQGCKLSARAFAQFLWGTGFNLQPFKGGRQKGVHKHCGEGAHLETGVVRVSNALSQNLEDQRMENTVQLGTTPS